MEEHFLKEYLDGEPEFNAQPWYNLEGDCIHYQAADEATYAERVDSYITLYRSALDDRAIGFQIKGVTAILQKFHSNRLTVKAKQEEDQSISLVEIILDRVLEALESGQSRPTPEQARELRSLLPELHHIRIPLKELERAS